MNSSNRPSSSQGAPFSPSSRLQAPPPATIKPPPPSAVQGDAKAPSDIPTYDEAVAESLAPHPHQPNGSHSPTPPTHAGYQSGGAQGATGPPHRVVVISQPDGPNHHHPSMSPPYNGAPTVILYSQDPGAARRRALNRFLKAFVWAWLVSMLLAFMTGAIQFVDYDDDGDDWNGWRVTGISNFIRRGTSG